MQFTLIFSQDNAAFRDYSPTGETARILKDVARRYRNGELDGVLFDINGNRIGHYETTEGRTP